MSEKIDQTPAEALANPTAAVVDHADNSDATLGEVLSEAGFEGLSPEDRLSVVEHATTDDYMTAVDMIHRKVAPDESHEPHAEAMKLTNPKTGEIRSYAAKPEDRVNIMDHALQAAKQVAQKFHREGGSIDDALQRCGNLAAFGVVLAHMYKNGNGRSARTIGELIHNGYDSNDPESVANLETVSANRPDEGFRINSYVPSGEWADGRADQEPFAFLDTVAALDVPLDGASYAQAVRGALTTPRM